MRFDTGYLPDVEDELVAVGRIDGHGEPHGLAIPVEGDPGYFERWTWAVRRPLEEVGFREARCTYRDQSQ
jgi:hypothetical protein